MTVPQVSQVDLPLRPTAEGQNAPDLCSAHWSLGPGYHIFRTQGTTTGLVFFTAAGHGFFRARSGAVHVSTPGELTVYEPNVEQEYGAWPEAGTRWEFHWVHLRPRPSWTSTLRLRAVAALPGLAASAPLADDLRGRVTALWHDLHRDVRVGGPWRSELAVNLAERILLLASEASDERGGRAIDARVRLALELIARDPAADHSVPQLARAVGLSPSRFAHLFRNQAGLPVVETVIRARMREAEQLLARTEEPISEIAYRLGFSTPQHFSAQFRRWLGVAPRQYRERSRKA